MRFRLATIFWIFALLASAMATFGHAGVVPVAIVVGFWIYTPSRWPTFLFKLLFYAAIFGILIALLLPAIQYSHRSYRGGSCLGNLKQIELALHSYKETRGNFPPAYIADANGKPMHSWRVLILPYLEGGALYDLYDFDEPWDGPNNRLLWKYMPDYYRCPGCKRAEEHGLGKHSPHATSYFAVVGPQTVWPESDTTKLNGISEDNSQTVMLVESLESIGWMEPKDIRFEDLVEQLTNGSSNGHLLVQDKFLSVSAICYGRYITFADGAIEFIDNHLPEGVAEMFLTTHDEELLEREAGYHIYRIGSIIKWRRVYALAMFTGLSLLPFLRTAPSMENPCEPLARG